jgi:hypothetical protein
MKSVLVLAAVAGGLCLSTVASAGLFPGPDGFGYTGSTTTGNTYTTIKGNGGTRVTPADPAAATYDDRFYSVTIPFSFNFYGTGQTTAFISTNGFIALGAATNTGNALDTQQNNSYTNSTFAVAAMPLGGTGQWVADRPVIAPWWDDMQFTSGQQGGIYTRSQVVSGVNEFVIEWANVAFFNSTADGVSFQAVLRDNGTMSFFYGDSASSNTGNTLGASGTIGIHNVGGGTGNDQYLQYSNNQAAAVSNGFAVHIVPAPASLALAGLGGLLVARRRR